MVNQWLTSGGKSISVWIVQLQIRLDLKKGLGLREYYDWSKIIEYLLSLIWSKRFSDLVMIHRSVNLFSFTLQLPMKQFGLIANRPINCRLDNKKHVYIQTYINKKQRGILNIKPFDNLWPPLFSWLQDNQLTLQSMLVSPHLADLRPEADSWALTLRQVEDVLELWTVCQKKVLNRRI